MTKLRGWCVRAMILVTIAWPLVSEAGTVDLPGTSWSLSGRARVSGVARSGRRTRVFRDTNSVPLSASFTTMAFSAHDAAGWDYSGMYVQRGRSGSAFNLTFDASSETEFDAMLSAWIGSLAEETVTADGRTNALHAVVRRNKATLTATRRFTATSASGKARGTWTIRASGLRT